MSEAIETLLALYREQTDQARHHEDQRATMTNYVLVLAGAVLGLVNVERLQAAQGPLGCFLVVVGCFGAAVTAKHYERNRYHARLAGRYRSQIEALQPGAAIDREAARAEHRKEFPFMHGERLWKYWVTLHVVVAGLGAILAVLALRG